MSILQHMKFKSISIDSQSLGSWQRPYDDMMDMSELLINDVRRKRGRRRYCIENRLVYAAVAILPKFQSQEKGIFLTPLHPHHLQPGTWERKDLHNLTPAITHLHWWWHTSPPLTSYGPELVRWPNHSHPATRGPGNENVTLRPEVTKPERFGERH